MAFRITCNQMKINHFSVVLGASVFLTFSAAVSSAALIKGSGTEATFIYDSGTGNLQFKSETANKYTSVNLETNLAHVDLAAGDTATLMAATGFSGFGKVDADEVRFVVFEAPPCPSCLQGTFDYGNIMMTGLDIDADIIPNWFAQATFLGGGSSNSNDDVSYGIVPEPSTMFTLLLGAPALGLFRLRKSTNTLRPISTLPWRSEDSRPAG